MNNVKVTIASAFSKNNTGGNKAGVVLYRDDLSRDDKMKISGILGFSETAFVTKSEKADYKIEYFTPVSEVDLCGHATIATFSVMYLLDMIKKKEMTFEAKAGVLRVSVSEDGCVMMEQNKPSFLGEVERECFKSSMDISGFHEDYPIEIVSTGLPDMIVPMKDFKSLQDLSMDFLKFSKLSEEKNVVGMHAFSMENGEITCACRNFAPLYGINEESATGTASCALAAYLYKHGWKQSTYVFHQGHQLNALSEVTVKIKEDEKKEEISEIFVGGYGYIIEERNLMI